MYDAHDPAYRPLGLARDCREAALLVLREPRRLVRLWRAGALPRVRGVEWIPDLGFEVEVQAVPRRRSGRGR